MAPAKIGFRHEIRHGAEPRLQRHDNQAGTKHADMRITLGRYRETHRAAHAHDGDYAHRWLRDRAGQWRLAYDVPLPGS